MHARDILIFKAYFHDLSFHILLLKLEKFAGRAQQWKKPQFRAAPIQFLEAFSYEICQNGIE